MSKSLSRRRLLEIGGVGTTLAFAGCNSLSNNDPDGSEGDGGDTQVSVTVFADLTDDQREEAQAEIEDRQAEIQQSVEENETSQQEAQLELQQMQSEIQAEFIADSTASLSDDIQSSDGLSLEEAEEEAGALLVSGAPTSVVSLLEEAAVSGIAAEDEFAAVQEQLEEDASGSQSTSP